MAIAVNDSTEAAKKFVTQMQTTFYTAKDDEAGNIALEYGVTGIPETFFIDAEGIIQEKFSGAITREVIEKFLQTEIVELEGRVLASRADRAIKKTIAVKIFFFFSDRF